MKYILTIFLLFFSLNLSAQLVLPSVFSDNMVLQRDIKIPVWGKAKPRSRVTVSFLNQKISVIADDEGCWKVELAPVKANFNPQKMTIETDNDKIVFKNVLVGDVWLCSGQSNMQFDLAHDKFVNKFAPTNTIQNIRYFSVWRFNFKPYECDNCFGEWNACAPDCTNKLSAVAFYFARALENKINAPIGLLEADYGGTRVEAWTDANTLRKWQHLKDELAPLLKFKNNKDFSYLKKMEKAKWFADLKKVDKGFAENWMSPNINDANWKSIQNPIQWKNANLKNYSGTLWYRKKILIPEDWKNKNIVINIGPTLDYEITWLNGKEIGAFLMPFGNWYPHSYVVKKGEFKTGENTIVVCVFGYSDNAGMLGHSDSARVFPEDDIEKSIRLNGKWKIAKGCPADKYVKAPPSLTLNPNTLSLLFNSMIAPVIPYAIKGAIWYQGESNRANANQYTEMFTDMIKSWRAHWEQGDFPFYFVQIAPFNYNDGATSAPLQEAQRLALTLTNTGMAVTMDIGDLKDIHPTNKKDVGERLALWALAKTYGFKNIIYSGPLYKSYKIEGNKIIISFDYAEGLKTSDGAPPTFFEISGADGKFYPANAKINKDKIVLSADKVKKPVAARFAWIDTAQPNLCNKAGLPASPFRTNRKK